MLENNFECKKVMNYGEKGNKRKGKRRGGKRIHERKVVENVTVSSHTVPLAPNGSRITVPVIC